MDLSLITSTSTFTFTPKRLLSYLYWRVLFVALLVLVALLLFSSMALTSVAVFSYVARHHSPALSRTIDVDFDFSASLSHPIALIPLDLDGPSAPLLSDGYLYRVTLHLFVLENPLHRSLGVMTTKSSLTSRQHVKGVVTEESLESSIKSFVLPYRNRLLRSLVALKDCLWSLWPWSEERTQHISLVLFDAFQESKQRHATHLFVELTAPRARTLRLHRAEVTMNVHLTGLSWWLNAFPFTMAIVLIALIFIVQFFFCFLACALAFLWYCKKCRRRADEEEQIEGFIRGINATSESLFMTDPLDIAMTAASQESELQEHKPHHA